MRTLSERDRQRSASSEGGSSDPQPQPSTSSQSQSTVGWGTRPSNTRWADPSEAFSSLQHDHGELQDSISAMQEEYIDRRNAEPSVNLRYGSQGTDSSSISMN